MSDNFRITPTEKQTSFITTEKKFACMSGGYGAGKTMAGCLRGLILSQHPKNVGLIGRNCYDDETEILTEKRGWVLFKNLLKSDKVATLKNEEMIWEKPSFYYKSSFDGEMIGIKQQNVDLLITSNHKLYVSSRKTRKKIWHDYQFIKAEDIYGTGELYRMTSVHKYNLGKTSLSKDFFEFLGFWFVEGHASIYKKNRYRLVVSQRLDKSNGYVESLLNRNGFSYGICDKGNGKCNYVIRLNTRVKTIIKELSKYGKAKNKWIPLYIKSAPKDYIESFLYGFKKGDGHFKKNNRDCDHFYTSSKQLADDIHELIVRTEKSACVNRDWFQKNPFYVITVRTNKRSFPVINKNHWYKKKYKGMVYCVEVSTHIVYVRRNGKAVWCSQTYRELADTTRKTFFEILPPEYYDDRRGGRWSPTENNLRLINGSEILFRHLDTIAESELKSLNLGWFFIDQAEEIGLPVWRVLQSRLRLNTVPNRYGFISCNPEPGSWIEEIFKRPFDDGTLPKDFFYLDTASYDNPYLPSDYVDMLRANYPEELQKRYIEGRWDVLQNMVYPEFDNKVHVIRPFKIHENWERVVALDHGMVNPTGVLWAAIDYDYNLFIYDEYYLPGIVSQHSKAVKEKTGDQEISMWLIDPSTQNKTREKDGRMWSVMEEYEDYGLYFIPANNQLLAGINRVKEFLRIDAKRINPITRQKAAPRVFIFSNCVNLIWEIRQYKWRKLRSLTLRNVPEQPVDYADHLLDCLRYIIMSRFPPPQKTPDGRLMVSEFDRRNSNLITANPSQKEDTMLGSLDTTQI